jgi:hypothetical protein
MQKLTFIALAMLAFMSCKKQGSNVTNEIKAVYFYRLGIESLDGKVEVSRVVPVRIGREMLGTDNPPGNGNGGNGQGQSHNFNGDTCNPNTPRFCEKHPWHKKCTSPVLPLKLDYFTVQAVNNKPVVSWKPLIETDISRYFIQRSADAIVFENVGFVNPKGVFTVYTYTDNP